MKQVDQLEYLIAVEKEKVGAKETKVALSNDP
jgi:hypothetical protein